jgi:glycosyltransferase involved in cell wall biosynthesis
MIGTDGLRIGHFVTHLPVSGGITTMVLGLSGGSIELGHRIVLYGYGRGDDVDLDRRVATVQQAEELGAEVRLFRRPPWSLPPLMQRADGLIERLTSNADRLDVLVIHGPFSVLAPSIQRAARRGQIACVACPHDPYSPALFASKKVRKDLYWRSFERPYLAAASAIHLLAPSHEALLRARGVTTPTFVVPNGLDASRLDVQGPLGSALRPGEALRMLYLGRWDVHNKGLDLLLQALASDRSLAPSVRLRLGGRATDAQRDELARLVEELQLGSTVTLEGFIPDVDTAIRGSHVVVLPSRFDGFGQVVIESLALGTPVISSARAGASEYLGPDDGVLVTEPSAVALAEALRSVRADHASLREAAIGARARLASEFSWKVLAERWVDGVEAILSAARR